MHSGTWPLAVAGLTMMAATGVATAGPAWGQAVSIPRPVSLDVVWPTAGEVDRRDGNGLSIAGGVATVDGSDQYGLRALGVDAERQSVTFVYVDAWTLTSARPPSCSFTFRHVERALTQAEANALSDDLATAEMHRLETEHPDIAKVGGREVEGSAVTRRVDHFTLAVDDGAASGLSKTWVFVLDAKAYYVNKVCLAPDVAALTVIDQLIGMNYRTGITPPVSEPAPPPPVVAESALTSPMAAPVAVAEPPAVGRSAGWRMPRPRLPGRP